MIGWAREELLLFTISAGVVDVAPNPLKPGVRFRRIGGHSDPGVDWCEIS